MQLQAPQRCHKPPDATNLEATPEKGAQFLGHLGCLGCLGIWVSVEKALSQGHLATSPLIWASGLSGHLGC